MSALFNVDHLAKSVAASEEDPATICNVSGGTLYYKNASDVDTNDSSLANGANVEVSEPNWIVAAANLPVKVMILRNADRGDQPFPESREQIRSVDGPVYSGTTGTLAGVAESDTVIYCKNSKTHYVNEGTAASPYWTPANFESPGLLAVYEDFRGLQADILSGAVPAITDTGTVNYTSKGARVVGLGLAETDAGLAAGTDVEGSFVGRITATNEDAKGTGLAGSVVAQFQPDTHAPLVVDVTLTNVSAITTRSLFVGWVGAVANDLAPPITGSATTATFAPDDIAGLFQSTGLTDADGLMAVSEKSNTAGTQTSLVASATLAAAGTYQRFRVEVQADGTTVAFVDKAQVAVIPGASGAGAHADAEALDADEEVIPLVMLGSLTTSTASADIKRFAFWGKRA